jgi:hypothetical protein
MSGCRRRWVVLVTARRENEKGSAHRCDLLAHQSHVKRSTTLPRTVQWTVAVSANRLHCRRESQAALAS